jgi:class 3 adenylate cyclase
MVAGAGTALAVVFAATFPDATTGLVIVNGYARFLRAPDYPWGAPEHAIDALREAFLREWGTGRLSAAASPGTLSDEEHARLERSMASPRTAAALVPLQYATDVRTVLPLVQAPTLIVHRRDNAYVRAQHGRYLAEHIPDARYLELPGDQQDWKMGFEQYAVDVEELLTGNRGAGSDERVLATLLFVDIVESTSRTARMGDAMWQRLLERFDGVVQRQLTRFRGRVVNTRGDDYLATFDGPARAVACAQAVRDGVRGLGLEVRAGLHTGEVVPHGNDITGLAVDIAARISALAQPSEIIVSRTVVDLVAGSGLSFVDAGLHTLKGISQPWQVFRVVASEIA